MSAEQENGIRKLPDKDSNNETKGQPNKENLSFCQRISSWRGMTAFIVWCGFLNATLLGNSFNMALVCMTGSSPPPRVGENTSSVSVMNNTGNSTVSDRSQGEFDWDSATQGLILSSAMYLGFVAPPAVGFLAKKFGPRRVVGIMYTARSAMVLLYPIGARTHVYILIAMRIVAGLVSNSLSPSSQELWSHWAPDQEKVQLISLTMSGVNIGSLLASLISGFLCTIPVDNGWPFIFYVFGGTSIIWSIVWCILVHDTPDEHPWITEKEKLYIAENIKTKADKRMSVPYRDILKSRPMWAYFVIQTVHKWCTTIFFTYLPKYMRDVLRFPIEQNAIVSSVPYASRFLGVMFWGTLADQMTRRNVRTTTNRKIVQATGFLASAALTAAIGFVSEDRRVVGVVLFVITMFFQSCTFAGASVVPLDMAPSILVPWGCCAALKTLYRSLQRIATTPVNQDAIPVGVSPDMHMTPRLASVISGICQGAGGVIAMFAPITVAYLTPDGTLEQWRSVFYIIIACYVFGVSVFVIFGSAEVQPWGGSPKIDNTATSSPSNTSVEIGKPIKDDACANGHFSHGASELPSHTGITEGQISIFSTDSFKNVTLNSRSPDLANGKLNYGFTDDEINRSNDIKTVNIPRGTVYTHVDDVTICDETILNTRL